MAPILSPSVELLAATCPYNAIPVIYRGVRRSRQIRTEKRAKVRQSIWMDSRRLFVLRVARPEERSKGGISATLINRRTALCSSRLTTGPETLPVSHLVIRQRADQT